MFGFCHPDRQRSGNLEHPQSSRVAVLDPGDGLALVWFMAIVTMVMVVFLLHNPEEMFENTDEMANNVLTSSVAKDDDETAVQHDGAVQVPLPLPGTRVNKPVCQEALGKTPGGEKTPLLACEGLKDLVQKKIPKLEDMVAAWSRRRQQMHDRR